MLACRLTWTIHETLVNASVWLIVAFTVERCVVVRFPLLKLRLCTPRNAGLCCVSLLLKISHVSAKIIGLPTPMLSEIIDHAILKKARAVATESDHPLSTYFHVLPSRRRYRCLKCKTSRYSRSFVPVAIRMLNAK